MTIAIQRFPIAKLSEMESYINEQRAKGLVPMGPPIPVVEQGTTMALIVVLEPEPAPLFDPVRATRILDLFDKAALAMAPKDGG